MAAICQPLYGLQVRGSTYGEDAAKHGNEQDDARNIELPEERCCQTLATIDLIWCFKVVERSSFPSLERRPHEASNERNAASGVDDCPHTHAPPPGCGIQYCLTDVTADPCVDL